jgi:AcrR family transcriptional regulator
MATNHWEDLTRERILDTAEALFAQKGYQAVSIREITRCSECNLAAVNYHFGTKENLYLEVFRQRWIPRARRVQENFRTLLARYGWASADNVVRALAESFLEGPLSDEERLRHHQLMAREMAQPTAAFEVAAEEVMRPFFQELESRFTSVLPAGFDHDALLLDILSIFSMVLYFNFARVAVSRLTGRRYNPDFRAQLVDHITAFSLEGLGVTERGVHP